MSNCDCNVNDSNNDLSAGHFLAHTGIFNLFFKKGPQVPIYLTH